MIEYDDFVSLIKPGDLFVYTGHALIAYDVAINPITGKKDVLILNSTQSPYISTRLKSTTKLSYNLFKNRYDSKGLTEPLEAEAEGTIQLIWLSDINKFVSNNKIACSEEECAVVRPFYENENGEVAFNYTTKASNCEKSTLRTQYPGLFIEKTVNVGDKSNVYVGDKLIYTVKITNKSAVATGEEVDYAGFNIQEKIGSYVKLLEVGQCSEENCISATISDSNTASWEIKSLGVGKSVELTYTVQIKNDVSNVHKTIKSEGKLYSEKNSTTYITTGTVENKIIPKVSKTSKSYKECFNEYKDKYTGLELVNNVYKCSNNIDFRFDKFQFENMFEKKNLPTSKASSNVIYLKTSQDDITNKFTKMILNNYWSGLAKYSISNSPTILLPRWSGSKTNIREKTIYSENFKNGDILIYSVDYASLGTPTSDIHTNESGLYAFIYIDGKFIGVNHSGTAQERNEFTYKYYEESKIAKDLYSGYTKLTANNKERVLEFANYQTLFDKDYYVILRPELVIKEMVNIDLISPLKTQYIQNFENLDLTGGILNLTYNDGTIGSINLTDEEVKISGFDNSKIGSNTINVLYDSYSLIFNVDIISKEVEKIEVITKPTKTQYTQNFENLDLTGGVLKVTYNDKSTENISLNSEKIKVSGFNNSKIGQNIITVEYEDQTAEFNVEIVQKKIEKVEIITKPIKTQYIQYIENLDLTGGVIKVTYNDNSTDNISLNNERIKVGGFNNSKIGTNTINVLYDSFSMTFNVDIISKKIEEVEVITNPIKTQYIQNIENLDLTGGVLKVTYNDKSTDNISLSNERIKANGFDNSKVGLNVIYIEYEGQTAEFNVEIVQKKIEKVEVITKPIKTQYIQNIENLDLTGGVIKVTYNDNSTDNVSLMNENVKISGFDNNKVGLNDIYVEYEGQKTEFNIEIISKSVKSIEIITNPTKMQYIQNIENLDLTGGVLKVTYNDNSTENISITNENIQISGFDNSKIGFNTIYIEYEGQKTKFDIEILTELIENPQTGTKVIHIITILILCTGLLIIKKYNKSPIKRL